MTITVAIATTTAPSIDGMMEITSGTLGVNPSVRPLGVIRSNRVRVNRWHNRVTNGAGLLSLLSPIVIRLLGDLIGWLRRNEVCGLLIANTVVVQGRGQTVNVFDAIEFGCLDCVTHIRG
ncbi:hypothetical protein HanPI659440_Chr04g0163211 [Helianthus annuus]|nr:hypothetical protein HanPI659440_Chr04g0163211 [Helianthus annuus]